MDPTGRLFLISSFAASFVLCVGSKLMDPFRSALTGSGGNYRSTSYFRLVSDGAVLVLHFIYLVSSRDAGLVHPVDSFRFLLDAVGSTLARIYIHVQFLATVVGNHYMSVCACDVVVEYLDILLQRQYNLTLDHCWRCRLALATNFSLTFLNCCSKRWTGPTFTIYMKSLFMSFWLAKIWFNIQAIQTNIRHNWEAAALLLGLTVTLLLILVSIKELHCFPPDMTSANQTVLLPLYEFLAGMSSPELSIIVACYYSDSLNNFFLSSEPFIAATRTGQLPCALSFGFEHTCTPVILLLVRFTILTLVSSYLGDSLDLLGAIWNSLLLVGAVLFDIALIRAHFIENIECCHVQGSKTGKLQLTAKALLHVGFQLANIGWICHRMTELVQVVKMTLLIAAVTAVVLKAVQSELFVEICCKRLKLRCIAGEELKEPHSSKLIASNRATDLDDLV